jgi:hypothetical protein
MGIFFDPFMSETVREIRGGRTMGFVYDPLMAETVHLTAEERRAAAEVRMRTGEPPFQLTDVWRVRRRRSRVGSVLMAGLRRLLDLFRGSRRSGPKRSSFADDCTPLSTREQCGSSARP